MHRCHREYPAPRIPICSFNVLWSPCVASLDLHLAARRPFWLGSTYLVYASDALGKPRQLPPRRNVAFDRYQQHSGATYIGVQRKTAFTAIVSTASTMLAIVIASILLYVRDFDRERGDQELIMSVHDIDYLPTKITPIGQVPRTVPLINHGLAQCLSFEQRRQTLPDV
jgi:hypothetical protein